MAFDRDGWLWFGTIGGISRYAGKIWQEARDDNLVGQRVNTVLTDRAGRVWVGMERNGLALWDGSAWEHFGTANGLPDDRIVALFEDAASRIWVSTGAGVGYLNHSAGWQFQGVASPIPVYAFDQDSSGVLWLAAENGLYRWTPAAGLDSVPELAGKRVNALHQAGDGTFWAGTQTDGLLRLVGGDWQGLTDSGKPMFNDIVVNGIVENVRRQPVGRDVQRRAVEVS